LGKYFPEVGDSYDTDRDKLVIYTDLVCIQSNRWIDVQEEDRYIPFYFKTNSPLDDEQEELMIKYIEKYTDTIGVLLILIRKLGSDTCEYRCLLSPIGESVGGDILYVSEKDSYKMKENLSILEKDYCFLTSDPNCGKAHVESKELNGIWYIPTDLGDMENKYTVKNHSLASKITNIPCQDGIFYNLSDHQKMLINDIGEKKLPSIKVEKRKLLGLVNKLIKTEDPLYTPVKLKECLKNGRFHFYDAQEFFRILSEVKNDDVSSVITDTPVDIIISLRELEIPYIATKNNYNDLYEITFLKNEQDLKKIDFNINDIVIEGCKNNTLINEGGYSDLCKLDTIIIDGYGICTTDGDIVYSNPETGKTLPFDIIHSFNTYKNGLDIMIKNYNPHKFVNITIPVEIEIDVIDDCHVSIYIKTEKEELFLSENIVMEHRPGEIELLKHLIKKLWKKGYLFNNYGLACAHYHGKYETGCIEKPWWFLQENNQDLDRSRDMINFISIE